VYTVDKDGVRFHQKGTHNHIVYFWNFSFNIFRLWVTNHRKRTMDKEGEELLNSTMMGCHFHKITNTSFSLAGFGGSQLPC
jgi:hypothetical protein